ncbi:MAG: SPOR domain-containing protein [Gammaproteobacteria bacterium]|nr:SPOR domain-containing protein [Gammaproteobacteria bacterium]
MKPDLKNPDKSDKTRSRGLFWFVAGIVVAVVVVFAFPAIHDAVEDLGQATVEKSKALQERIAKTPAGASSPAADNAFAFDFYEILTHPTQILTSGESGEVTSSAASQTPISQPGHYILQVASVKDAQGAEKLKAQLALWGIRSHIQTVDVQGDTWHRIRVGPITELAKLNALRKKLDRHNLQPLLIRVDN